MENKTYKRQETGRGVSPEVRQKISNSLRAYNNSHPRGKASDGSLWSARISQGLVDYWSKIEKETDDGYSDTIL